MKFFEDGENFNEFEEAEIPDQPHRLVDGIDLKDLMSGKDVIFKINQEYEGDSIDCYNNSDQEDNECSEIISYDKLRGKRGAPDADSTFQSLSASMVNVDDEGYVKKEVITSGSGAHPPDHSRVTIHYNFYKEHDDEPFDSTYLRGKSCRFCLNLGETIPGLEIAVKSMKKRENSRFLIKWEVAFGRQGCPPRIGEECDILADITLIDYTEIVSIMDNVALTQEEMKLYNFEQTIREVKNIHCSGNEEFNSGNVKDAIRNYKKCIKKLNEVRISNQEEEEKMFGLKIKCLVNLAICFNKQGRSELACVACRDALSIDPNNVKAAFQYGKATLHLSNFESAEKWLKQAWKLSPGNEYVSQELDKLEKKKKEAELEDLTFCQRAFGTLNLDATKRKDRAGSKDDAK